MAQRGSAAWAWTPTTSTSRPVQRARPDVSIQAGVTPVPVTIASSPGGKRMITIIHSVDRTIKSFCSGADPTCDADCRGNRGIS